MKLGMIGLGRMGANMTSRLLQGGHKIVVYDRSADAVKASAGTGATSVADLVNQLRILRDMGISTLQAIDTIEVQPAPGALYFYVKLLDDSKSSMEVAEDLLMNGLVASVPGEPFGSPGHLRFNFAVERPVLEEGLERITAFFK